jgi:hypothetical protein
MQKNNSKSSKIQKDNPALVTYTPATRQLNHAPPQLPLRARSDRAQQFLLE